MMGGKNEVPEPTAEQRAEAARLAQEGLKKFEQESKNETDNDSEE